MAAGIGVTADREADYYIMTHDAWNTFSKEEADHQTEVTKGRISVKEVIKLPLLNINDVMGKHFREAPTFLSVDTGRAGPGDPQEHRLRRDSGRGHLRAESLVSSTTRRDPTLPVHDPGITSPAEVVREHGLCRLEDS